MHATELWVIVPARIYPIIHEGAVLSDPDRPESPPLTVATITDRGAWTECGTFLTIHAIDAMRLDRNGPSPKRAA